MAQAGGSDSKGCWKTGAIIVGVIVAVGVVGFGLLAFLIARAFDGWDVDTETGCAASDVPIVRAAGGGDVAAVRRELDRGARPEAGDNDGNSPLACAGPRGHVEVVKLLLDRGANPNTVSRDGDTVLADSVRFCQPKVAEILLGAEADPERSGRQDSVLSQAVALGEVDMVKVLLAGHADPASYRPSGPTSPFERESTSLCPKPSDEGRLAILTLLLGADADPTAVLSGAAEVPAALGGEVVDAALAKGANPNGPGAGPVVAIAAAAGNPDMVAKLLAAGADPDRALAVFGGGGAPGEHGGPSGGTTTSSSTISTTRPPGYDEFNTAVACGGRVDPASCDVKRSLAVMVLRPGRVPPSQEPVRPEVAKRQTARDRATGTPLMVAAWDGNVEIVRQLLAADADVNAVSPDGFTALQAAAGGGNSEVTLLLLQVGGTKAPAGEVVKPSDIAASSNHPMLAKLLRDAGR